MIIVHQQHFIQCYKSAVDRGETGGGVDAYGTGKMSLLRTRRYEKQDFLQSQSQLPEL